MKILGSDITIYGADEQGKAVVPFTAGSKIGFELMRRHDITLSFVSDTYITILKGDYVEHDNIRYTVMADYVPDGEVGRYKYEVEFHAPEILFQNLPFFYVNSGVIEAEWSLTANPSVFIDAVIACIAQHTGETWVKGAITPVDPISLSFSEVSVFDALTAIAEACETEWYVRGTTIYLTRCEEGVAATLTEGLSVKTITPKDTKEDFCNRVFAFGSTRNLSRTYRNADTDTAELRRRLKMPAGVSFVDSASLQAITNPAPGQIVARVKIFDEVYPKIVCAVASLHGTPSTDQEGVAYMIYSIRQNNIIWDNDYLTTEPLSVHFEDGALAGRDFEVYANGNPALIRLPKWKSDECKRIAGSLPTADPYTLFTVDWKKNAQDWLAALNGFDSPEPTLADAISKHTAAMAALSDYESSHELVHLSILVMASNEWTDAADAWYAVEGGNHWFELLPKSETIYIPNTVLRPQIGDSFVLYNYDISLVDDQLVPAAELQLQAVAQAWVDDLDKDTNAYNVQTMAAYCQTNGLVFDFGQRINIVSDRFAGGSRLSRIIGYERTLANPHDCQYIIGDTSRYNRIGALESKVDEIEYQQYINERSTGQMPRILRTIDNITPSESNVLSSVRSLETFVKRSATGATFEGNGKTFGVEVDADGNLVFHGNIYATGSVSAQGVGVGGGGTSYNRLDTWAAYIPGTTDTWVLSALLGHDLHTRVTALESDTPNVALGVPTTNYVTLTVNAVSRQLSIHGHGHTFASLSSKPTTISGYGITDSLIYEGDARLTNSRPASDVSAWAKAATKPSYSYSDVGAAAASHTHGNVSNDGKIGSTASLVIVTGTAGALTAKTAGTTAQYLRGDGSWATPPDTVYVHPTKTARNVGGASHFITAFTSDTLGHVTGITTAAMTKADVEAVLTGNSITSHYHDDRYFQKGELFTKEGSGTEADPYRIRANFPFYGVSSVAALGIGSGGGGTSYDRLDSWTGYDVDQAGWVLSAGLGHDTYTRVLALEASTPNVAWGVDGSGYTPLSVNGITRQLSTNGHTHDDRYYTETEVNTLLANKANWDTAYGWGNHASAGYALDSAFNTHNTDNARHITGAERTKWNGVVTDFGNLEIGGRNLYVNTIGYTPNTPFVHSWTAADSYRMVFDGKIIHCKQPFKAGDIVTIQAESDAMWSQSHGPSAATDGKLGMWVYLCATPNSSTYRSAVFLPNDLGSDKTKFIRTYSLPEVSGLSEFYISMRLNGYSYPSGTAHTANLWNVKLERGNIATDWSPAPEDVDASIATVQTNLNTHAALTNNPHGVTKTQVGLSNVENTALSTWAGSGNITAIGTVTSGTWSANTIAVTKGGTGKTSVAANSMLYATANDTYGEVATTAFGRGLLSAVSGTEVAGLRAATAAKLTTPRALTIGATAKNFDGSAAVSWSLAEIGAASVAGSSTQDFAAKNLTVAGTSITTGMSAMGLATPYAYAHVKGGIITENPNYGVGNAGGTTTQNRAGIVISSNHATNNSVFWLSTDATVGNALNIGIGNTFNDTNKRLSLSHNGLLTASNFATANADGAYMQVGPIKILYDATNNAIRVEGNIYATGSNTAFGVGGGAGGGGLITNVYGTSGFGGSYSDVDLSSTFNAYAINSLYTALQGKQNTITGAVSTLVSSNLYANYALVSGATGKVQASGVTATELFYLSGVSSNIQTQLNAKPSVNSYPTAFSWSAGSTSGPTATISGSNMTAISVAAIPAASATASGIVTTGAQSFSGEKSFNSSVWLAGTNALVLDGASQSIYSHEQGGPVVTYNNDTAVTTNHWKNIFEGLLEVKTGNLLSVDIAAQPGGTIQFANGATANEVPAIIGKSSSASTGTGLTLSAATANTNAIGDMTFGVRQNNNTDYTDFTKDAFRWSRYATAIMSLTRGGKLTANEYAVSALASAPASVSAAGVTGEIRFTSTGLFICIATNTWRKATISTF